MSEDQESHLSLVDSLQECPKDAGRRCDCARRAVTPDCMPAMQGVDESSVAVEAQAMVYGDRQDDYGHPRDNFTVIAQLWTIVLQGKLAEGEFITPEDFARCMVQVKVARQLHSPKRDNLVDAIGYLIGEDRLEAGR